jgi:hypothetical protein
MITFAFTSQVQFVSSIGFLNVDNSDTTVTVTTAESETTLRVPNIGTNSVQSLSIETEFVSSLKVTLGGLAAITYIDFCYVPESSAPNFAGPPALNPTPIVAPTPIVTPTVPTPALPTGGAPTPVVVPTPVPPISTLPTPPVIVPTPATMPTSGSQPTPVNIPTAPIMPTPAVPSSTTPPPISVCIEAVVDFDTLPDGRQLTGGQFVANEYLEFYGFTMSASGGFGVVPRLFNTSDFGDGTSRNAALGR